jgi:hypothetical protein
MRYDRVVAVIVKEPFGKLNHPFVSIVDHARRLSNVSDEGFALWKKEVHDGFVICNRPALPIKYSKDMKNAMVDQRCLISAFNCIVHQVAGLQGTLCLFVCIADGMQLY